MVALAQRPRQARLVGLEPVEIGKTPINFGRVEFIEVQPALRILFAAGTQKFAVRVARF